MGLRSELAPPEFWLSVPKMQAIWQFIDVETLSESYGSRPNVRPLLGSTAPFVSDGSGDGLAWTITAKINPVHAFLTSPGQQHASARSGGDPYDELLQIKRWIQEFGPTPLAILHREAEEDITVALTNFTSEVNLQQSNPSHKQRPSIIPVGFNLIERRDYHVTVS